MTLTKQPAKAAIPAVAPVAAAAKDPPKTDLSEVKVDQNVNQVAEPPAQSQESPGPTLMGSRQQFLSWEKETLALLEGIREEADAIEQEQTRLTERLKTLADYEVAIQRTIEIAREFMPKGASGASASDDKPVLLDCDSCGRQWTQRLVKPIECPNCDHPFLEPQGDLEVCKVVLNGVYKDGSMEPLVECLDKELHDTDRGAKRRHSVETLTCTFLVFHLMGLKSITELHWQLRQSRPMRMVCHQPNTLAVPSQPTLWKFFHVLEGDACQRETLLLLRKLKQWATLYVKFHPQTKSQPGSS